MSFWIRNRLLSLFFLTLLFVSLDQFSKIWIKNSLCHKTQYFLCKKLIIIPEMINLTYKENSAAAFSIMSTISYEIRQPILIFASLFGLFFFLSIYFKLKDSNFLVLLSFSLLLGGAIGNLIDRVRLGYVIDFIDISASSIGFPDFHWPVFNIADFFIVVSMIFILFFLSNNAK